LPALPLLCLIQACLINELLKKTRTAMPLEQAAQRLPYHATAVAVVAGAAVAIIDLALEGDHVIGTLLNCGMILAAAVYIVGRLVRRAAWPARPENWAIVAAVSLFVMAFSFQKFMPEFARFRSISATAARLQTSDDGRTLPVVYFDQKCEAAAFPSAPVEVHQFSAEQLTDFRQFVLGQEKSVIVATPWRYDQMRHELGDLVDLAPTRGGRGRLFMASSRAHALMSARGDTAIRR
jgi:hypothetical protein